MIGKAVYWTSLKDMKRRGATRVIHSNIRKRRTFYSGAQRAWSCRSFRRQHHDPLIPKDARGQAQAPRSRGRTLLSGGVGILCEVHMIRKQSRGLDGRVGDRSGTPLGRVGFTSLGRAFKRDIVRDSQRVVRAPCGHPHLLRTPLGRCGNGCMQISWGAKRDRSAPPHETKVDRIHASRSLLSNEIGWSSSRLEEIG